MEAKAIPRETGYSRRLPSWKWLWLKPVGRTRLPPVLLLLIGATLIACARLASYQEPVDRDNGFYLTVGHEMHNGKKLYRDLIDHKPPGIFVTCYLAEFLTGYGRAEIYFLNVAACVLSLVAGYACCAMLTCNRAAALSGAALWVAISGDAKLLANQPNAESHMNALTLIALACMAAGYRKPSAWSWMLTAGICFGTASLFKQVNLAIPALVMAGGILVPHSGRTRRRAFGEAALVGSVIVAVWLGTLAVFKINGTYDEFVRWVFVYGREYAGNVGTNLAASFQTPFPDHAWILLPPIVIAFIGLGLSFWRRNWQPGLMLGMLALGTQIAVALPGKTFPHYHQLWFPFAVLGFGSAVATAHAIPRLTRLSSLIAISIPLLIGTLQVPDLALSPVDLSLEKYGTIFRDVGLEAEFLNRTLLPSETLFQFGDDAEIYFLTQRHPPLPYLDCVRLTSRVSGESNRADMLNRLRICLPDAVLMDLSAANFVLHPKIPWKSGPMLPGESPPHARELIAFFTDNYRSQGPPIGRFVLLARNGSDLERRWAKHPSNQSIEEWLKEGKSIEPVGRWQSSISPSHSPDRLE